MVPFTMPITRCDRLAAQALAQGADQRDATGDGRLEQQVDAGAVGSRVQLGADVGQQLLVGGDDRLAVGERRGDQLASRLDAADDLDDQVDRRIGDDGVRIAGQHPVGQCHTALTADVAHRDCRDLEAQSGAGLHRGLLLGHQLHECRTDVAASEQADPDHVSLESHGERLGDEGERIALHCAGRSRALIAGCPDAHRPGRGLSLPTGPTCGSRELFSDRATRSGPDLGLIRRRSGLAAPCSRVAPSQSEGDAARTQDADTDEQRGQCRAATGHRQHRHRRCLGGDSGGG